MRGDRARRGDGLRENALGAGAAGNTELARVIPPSVATAAGRPLTKSKKSVLPLAKRETRL
jgi:hypothetical protein